MQMKKRFKGQAVSLGSAPAIVLILVVLGIVLAFGAMFQAEMADQTDSGSDALGIINDSLEGLETMGEWQPILAIAVIIAIALSVILGLFAFNRRGGL